MRFQILSAAVAITSLTGFTQAVTKIMALGDSITGSPGCWRAYLWQSLTQAGKANIDFVGLLSLSLSFLSYV